MKKCPCQSGKNFLDCCRPFIKGLKKPDTAEQLMRSRYSAYTLAEINYIKKTMQGRPLIDFDKHRAKQWAKKAHWLGLSVLRVGDRFVEFEANYQLDGKIHSIHEVSEFRQVGDDWYYIGELTEKND